MKKRIIILIGVIAFVLISLLTGITIFYSQTNIPDNYIAVFNGESGELAYRTYIYKIDNGHANSGFNYINTTVSTVSWGSSKTKEKVTKKGTVTWTDDVFKVAKDNGAYSYVIVGKEKYDIDTFASMFLMN